MAPSAARPSAPAPPRRPALRERYDRRSGELVAGAAARFARAGYDQTTMADLAASLGVATGALYHYFGGKETLLRAICDQLMEPLLRDARALLEDREEEPATERLRALVVLWVTHVCDHRDHMLVFQQERHVIEAGESWRTVRASRKAFERLAAGVVSDALTESGARGDRGPGRLAPLALLGMVNHTAQWYRPRGSLTPRQIAEGYVELVLGERA